MRRPSSSPAGIEGEPAHSAPLALPPALDPTPPPSDKILSEHHQAATLGGVFFNQGRWNQPSHASPALGTAGEPGSGRDYSDCLRAYLQQRLYQLRSFGPALASLPCLPCIRSMSNRWPGWPNAKTSSARSSGCCPCLPMPGTSKTRDGTAICCSCWYWPWARIKLPQGGQWRPPVGQLNAALDGPGSLVQPDVLVFSRASLSEG
jgi:hypothetical protein